MANVEGSDVRNLVAQLCCEDSKNYTSQEVEWDDPLSHSVAPSRVDHEPGRVLCGTGREFLGKQSTGLWGKSCGEAFLGAVALPESNGVRKYLSQKCCADQNKQQSKAVAAKEGLFVPDDKTGSLLCSYGRFAPDKEVAPWGVSCADEFVPAIAMDATYQVRAYVTQMCCEHSA